MKKIWIICLLVSIIHSPAFAFFNYKNQELYENQGYVGTLPDVTKSFHASEPTQVKPVFEKTKKFNSELKPVPRDNPAFVNIILKQDKSSPYLNDITEFIDMLEKIYDSIEANENVQLFASRVYFFTKNADYFRNKYEGKPESSYVSFQRLMELSLHANTVAQLRTEAEKYSPYLAYGGTGYIYNESNINEQLQYLKDEIEQTIVVLKEAN